MSDRVFVTQHSINFSRDVWRKPITLRKIVARFIHYLFLVFIADNDLVKMCFTFSPRPPEAERTPIDER